jgi:hypothetical protein
VRLPALHWLSPHDDPPDRLLFAVLLSRSYDFLSY